MIILSTAYLPPVEYFAILKNSSVVLIENHENYIRQSYRNRCVIAGPNGSHSLIVPVLHGKNPKSPVPEIEIDYSKRWIPVHIGAIEAAYSNSPFFEFYSDSIFAVLNKRHRFLLDLNNELLKELTLMLQIDKEIRITESFIKPKSFSGDYRFLFSPKVKSCNAFNPYPPYLQVFSGKNGFIPGLSIIDLIFNIGPEASSYLDRLTQSGHEGTLLLSEPES
jgi:hypothetical protein